MVTRKRFYVTFLGLRTFPLLFTLTPDDDPHESKHVVFY